MLEFDRWIIRQAERVTQPVQLWSGIDCLTLAGGAFSVASAIDFVCAIGGRKVYYVSAGWWAFYGIHGVSSFAKLVRSRPWFSNPAKVSPSLIIGRLLFLFLVLPLDVISAFGGGWTRFASMEGAFIWAGFVLMACDPLPPGKSRWRDLLESFRKLTPAAAGAR